jgi:hypothetical protein
MKRRAERMARHHTQAKSRFFGSLSEYLREVPEYWNRYLKRFNSGCSGIPLPAVNIDEMGQSSIAICLLAANALPQDYTGKSFSLRIPRSEAAVLQQNCAYRVRKY